jgi:DNA modification methylase
MTYQILKGNSLDLLPTLADNSIDAIVTDPPYGLGNPDPDYIIKAIQLWASGDRAHIPEGKGFMGKSWDSFVPPPAIWDECLRVLKPGGHLLAFAGTRTYDLMGISIRMAGFEIRDSIGWVYGSGFPKSLDVSKAIDKSDASNLRLQRNFEFTTWMKSTGITARQIDDITNTMMGSHYTTHPTQPTIATSELFDKLRPYLPEVPENIEKLVAERTVESENYKKREVIGQKQGTKSVDSSGHGIVPGGITEPVELDITAPATPEAQQWQGWGTALKPALEPIVVARKPLIGTVAENVLTHGTGGLNIDASRIGFDSNADKAKVQNAKWHSVPNQTYGTYSKQANSEVLLGADSTPDKGRWPANLILDEYTAELLDEQSGQKASGTGKIKVSSGKKSGSGTWTSDAGMNAEGKENTGIRDFGDSGGASRFFYVAKASKRDRNEGLEDLDAQRHSDRELDDGAGGDNPRNRTNQAKQNFHPTVKPTELMRYLVKLITPPGGTVLDPFTGSGSTGKAAILEGFDFIGIELTEDYWPIIEGRLKHAEAKVAERIKETSDQEQEKLF